MQMASSGSLCPFHMAVTIGASSSDWWIAIVTSTVPLVDLVEGPVTVNASIPRIGDLRFVY